MNGTYDRGSMGVMVLDESQLIPVSQNGVPNENFVENARENEIDRLVNNGYNENINSGGISGARNPYGSKAAEHAERYYGLVRSMQTDVMKICKTTGFSEEVIQKVKNYIFYDKHDLGGKTLEHFEPDFMMAESWQRLINGTPKQHDITLLKHEIMEINLIEQGYSQYEAHILTSRKYNYAKEAVEFYDNIKKYSDI